MLPPPPPHFLLLVLLLYVKSAQERVKARKALLSLWSSPKFLMQYLRSQMVGCDRNALLLESKVRCSSVGPHSRLPLIKPKLAIFSHSRVEVHRFTVVQVCGELHPSRSSKEWGRGQHSWASCRPAQIPRKLRWSHGDNFKCWPFGFLDQGLVLSCPGEGHDFRWHGSFQVTQFSRREEKMAANHSTLEGMRTGSWKCHLIYVSLWRISRMATVTAWECWKPAL